MASSTYYLTGVVTFASKTPTLGVLPIGAYVVRVHIHVLTAFNSSGTDTIAVGYSGTVNAYCTATDVSTTGVKSPTLGSGIGYDLTSRTVVATYAQGVADSTTGKAVVIVEYFLCRNPA